MRPNIIDVVMALCITSSKGGQVILGLYKLALGLLQAVHPDQPVRIDLICTYFIIVYAINWIGIEFDLIWFNYTLIMDLSLSVSSPKISEHSLDLTGDSTTLELPVQALPQQTWSMGEGDGWEEVQGMSQECGHGRTHGHRVPGVHHQVGHAHTDRHRLRLPAPYYHVNQGCDHKVHDDTGGDVHWVLTLFPTRGGWFYDAGPPKLYDFSYKVIIMTLVKKFQWTVVL